MYEDKTVKELLEDPRISPIAPDAIRGMDLSKQDFYEKTLEQLRKDGFGGNMTRGFERLFKAADSGDWYYPLYPEEECEEDPERAGTNLVWFPSDDPKADERPYILLVPGGGFVNVWNLTEGWPVADHFNGKGYHVFILTYRVAGEKNILTHEMDDFARAFAIIREYEAHFHVRWEQYITCGFSAGGHLICLWATPDHGYVHYGMPKPQAMFPVYPVVSWRQCMTDGDYDPLFNENLMGCTIEESANSDWEIPDHAEYFPPCAIFLAAEDTLVNPEHSKLLKRALDKHGILCSMEIGPTGGHGFADGTGMCMEGWPERAIEWFEASVC